VGGNIHASRAWKGENMNFVSYFTAPWFAKVLFLFVLFAFTTKDCEIASLPLHYIQGFGSPQCQGKGWQ
jgi:hypothetical protein